MITNILEKLIVCDLLNWPLKTSNNLWTGPNHKMRTCSDSSLITSVSFLPLKFKIQQESFMMTVKLPLLNSEFVGDCAFVLSKTEFYTKGQFCV